MRLLFIVFVVTLLNTSIACAQAEPNKSALTTSVEKQENVFGDNDPDFSTTEIPDKWRDESAVILCQSHVYTFRRTFDVIWGEGVEEHELERRRIKLLDRAAVETYSQFYFINNEDLGIRIQKPDKSIVTIDLTKAVPATREDNLPSVYEKRGRNIRKGMKKIAIENLEEGDVIDFYYNVKAAHYLKEARKYSFEDGIVALCNEYPAVKQKYTFELQNGFYLNVRGQSGAGQFAETKSGNIELKRYTLEDSARDKFYDERWSYVYRSFPSFKYQVIYLKDKTLAKTYLIDADKQLKTSFAKEELVTWASEILHKKNKPVEKDAGDILKFLNKYYKSVTDPTELARHAYYHYRYRCFFSPKRHYRTLSDEVHFIKCMVTVLNKKYIPCRVALAVPREVGVTGDAILQEEFTWMLKVDTESPVYLAPPDMNSNFGDLYSGLEGVQAIEFTPIKDALPSYIDLVSLPQTDYLHNGELEDIKVDFDSAMNAVHIYRKKTVKGHNKDNFYNVVLDEEEAKREEDSFYSASLRKKHYTAENSTKYRFTTRGMYNHGGGDKTSKLKDMLKEDFEVTSYDRFSLIYPGRYYEQKDLVYEEEFHVEKLLRKTGKHYIFNVGRLIGLQVEIGLAEQERRTDIYYENPRIYKNDIEVNVPEGYEVYGWEKLNISQETEAGYFKSQVTKEKNKIVIHTEKVYKHNFESRQNWQEIVAFLEAAFDFTQVKLLLKKKEVQ